MSETPQTPPPPEPPPAGSGRPAVNFNADQMKASVQSANPYDLGIMGAGLVAFIASLLPYYTVHISGFGGGSESAGHGFFGWFAMLLALVGSGILAARLFAGVTLPFPVRLTVLGLYAVALIFVLIAGLTWPGAPSGSGDATGHGFGYWLSLIVILAGGVLSFLRKDATD